MNYYRIWRDQKNVCTGLLLIVFWLEFSLPTVSRVTWKVKSGIFHYLFRKYFSYISKLWNHLVYNYSCPKIKKQKLHKLIFIFGLFFFSSSTKYSYCESENPSFVDSVAILNKNSKVVWLNWFLNLVFTSFSLEKKRSRHATLSGKITSK